MRNLRLGRGDRRGAFRLAFFFFVLRMGAFVFETHHVAETRELYLLITGIQSALFWSCFTGLIYLALEPYLRRRWPDRIISWNRLLAGEFRDPMIGRDILIGTAIGCLCMLLMYVRVAVTARIGATRGVPDVMDIWHFGVAGPKAFGQMFVNQLGASIIQAFMVVFMVLFLSLLLRREWAGITLSLLVLAMVFVVPAFATEPWIGLLIVSLVNVIFVMCGARVGPVALMATLTVFHVWVFYPVTSNLTAWYASSFVLIAVVLLALAVYSFYISLGGQKVFSGKLLEE